MVIFLLFPGKEIQVEVNFYNFSPGLYYNVESGPSHFPSKLGELRFTPWIFSIFFYFFLIFFKNKAVADFNECLPLFECVKQACLNCFMEIDWLTILIKLFNLEDENSNLTKVSILRILL